MGNFIRWHCNSTWQESLAQHIHFFKIIYYIYIYILLDICENFQGYFELQ